MTPLLTRQWGFFTLKNQHIQHIQHNMTNITIDNHSYELDTLSAEAKAQLQSLQFVNAELAQAAVLQTARMAYSKALQGALPSILEQAQASEAIRFN